MSKYDPLSEFLGATGARDVELTFTQLDQLVGGLPASARDHDAWWHGDETHHPHCRAWTRHGFAVRADRRTGVAQFTR